MELCPPFAGWRLDAEGTIHTPSGYRCTPEQIEAALWLLRVVDVRRQTLFADTPLVEPRRVVDLADMLDEDRQTDRIELARRHHQCPRCATNKRAAG